MELTITTKEIGANGFWSLRYQIDDFVKSTFAVLYEGAVRLGCNIPDDYYAPDRIQVGDTRLHKGIGLKYASNHKYNEDVAPTEEQLKQTVIDIQSLIDAAAEIIPAPFSIIITE